MNCTTNLDNIKSMEGLTLTINTADYQVQPRQRRLLSLPRDIRDAIWEYALVEPPRWSKTHKPHCVFKSRDSSAFEAPPFILSHQKTCNCRRFFVGKSACRCAARRGLGILLANRQVHDETSQIFWSRNTFCFDRLLDLEEFVGNGLSSSTRQLIQHISVAGEGFWNATSQSFFRKPNREDVRYFWETIAKCSGLRTLEVGPEYFQHRAPALYSLAQSLPKLERLAIFHLAVYTFRCWFRSGPPSLEDMDGHKRTLYVRSTYPVNFKEDFGESVCADISREFRTNFSVHVNRIVKTQLLSIPVTAPSFNDWHYMQLAPDLTDRNNSRTVTLPTGKKCKLIVYGLPQSRETRVELARADWKMNKPTTAGGLSRREKQRIQSISQHRKQKSNDEMEKERQSYVDQRALRIQARDEQWRQDDEAAREEKKQLLRRSVEDNREQRRLGRKRVPRVSAK